MFIRSISTAAGLVLFTVVTATASVPSVDATKASPTNVRTLAATTLSTAQATGKGLVLASRDSKDSRGPDHRDSKDHNDRRDSKNG